MELLLVIFSGIIVLQTILIIILFNDCKLHKHWKDVYKNSYLELIKTKLL